MLLNYYFELLSLTFSTLYFSANEWHLKTETAITQWGKRKIRVEIHLLIQN